MKIYLIGYMGSGKSTLGHELAKVLGIPRTDLDDEFEQKYKISIADFFEKYGENAFRELEHEVLTDISLIPDLVVSTGGGTPCFHANMELMNKTGLTIYLSATPELILSRIEHQARKRPVFQLIKGSDALQNIAMHLNTRTKFYEQSKITTDAENPDSGDLKKKIFEYFSIIS